MVNVQLTGCRTESRGGAREKGCQPALWGPGRERCHLGWQGSSGRSPTMFWEERRAWRKGSELPIHSVNNLGKQGGFLQEQGAGRTSLRGLVCRADRSQGDQPCTQAGQLGMGLYL